MPAAAWLLASALLAAPGVVAQVAPPPAEPTPTVTPPAAPVAPTVQPRATGNAARQLAEDAELRDLIPAPLTNAAITALAHRLGAAADAAETVADLAARYRTATDAEHATAMSAVRARLTNAFATTPGGGLEPTAGPELVAVLELSAAWRALLARADGDLFRHLLIVRTEHTTVTPALLAFGRAVERDDAVSADPIAGLRIPALLDSAGLSPEDRRRAEDALERQWSRMAAAITERRAARSALALDRARLLLQWGPAWELTATPREAAEKQRQLAGLDALDRAADEALRAVVRDSVNQLLRVVPQDAAARIRDLVDALAWPALFVQEELLAQAVTRAAQGAEPDLAAAFATVLGDLPRRLEPTRRELSRRASRAEGLDAVVANIELGASNQAAAEALTARLDLLDTIDRRRRVIRALAVQLRQMAISGAAPNAQALEERVVALDADIRTAEWLRQGLKARIAELQDGGREREDDEPGTAP